MNKLLKYILKGKREEFSVPVVIGRLFFLLFIGGLVSIFFFLCFLYIEGAKEMETEKKLESKLEEKTLIYATSLIPNRLHNFIDHNFPDWLVKKTYIFYLRSKSLSFKPECNDEDLKKISCFKYLQYLDLNSTNISDLSPLKGMPLTYLDIGKCKNVKDLTPLADCKKLEIIYVPSHIKKKDLEFIKKLPNIQEIWRDESPDEDLDDKMLLWEKNDEDSTTAD